jgi:FixJ family two-component response regulator
MVGRKRASFVAVVEDDVGVRTAVLELLQSCDIKARGFASAESFLGSQLRFQAACLVVDMRLPGMSGLELLQALQGSGLQIPAICSTAEADTGERVRQDLMKVGAVAVLGKPFDTGQLLTLIETALTRSRRRS